MKTFFEHYVFCVFFMAGLASCANGQKPVDRNAVTQSSLFSPSDTAVLHRVSFDTLATHNYPRDQIVPGPSTRIVLRKPEFFPEAWRAIGARGVPPTVDFAKYTVVLIGTDTYGSGDMNVAVDSVFQAGQTLYVIVQEYSNGAMIDVPSRGSLALVVPGVFDPASVTFIGRPTVNRLSHQ